MTDIAQPQTTDPVVSAAPAAEPVAAAPVTTSILGSTEIPETDAPIIETFAPEAPETPAPEAPATETPAPEAPAAPEAPKPETPAPTPTPEVPVEPPVYEPFTLPEGVKVDEPGLNEFTKMLGELELGKLDHAAIQSKGQALIDMHVKGVTETVNRLNDYYTQLHEKTKSDWANAFKSDPEIGGNRMNTTVAAAREAVRTYGGNEAQVKEFTELMDATGVGNHPAVLRLLSNMQNVVKKYTTESDNGNGGSNRIVPGARPAPSKVKDYEQFYSGSSS